MNTRAHPRECKCTACFQAYMEDVKNEWPNGIPDPLAKVTKATISPTTPPMSCGDKVVHTGKYASLGEGVVVRVADEYFATVRWQGQATMVSRDGKKTEEKLLQWLVHTGELRHVASPRAWADQIINEVPR